MKRPNLIAAFLFLAGLANNVQANAKENISAPTEVVKDDSENLNATSDIPVKISIVDQLRKQGRWTTIASHGSVVCN